MSRDLQKYIFMNELKEKNKEPIFVIGFPKSGNTWLARLLADVTRSNIDAINPVDASDNSLERDGKYLIKKAHEYNSDHIMNAPVVYIVRDIRDVLVSAFFFNNGFIHEDWLKSNAKCGWLVRFLSKAFFAHQVKRMNKRWCGNEITVLRNLIRGKKSKVGGWSDHILSCTEHTNVFVVKYEDLLDDTYSEMRKILVFLNIETNDVKLKETILNQSFEKKKVQFMRSEDSCNVKFLRSGKSGRFEEFFSPDLVREIESGHAFVMRAHGYKLKYFKGEK